MQEDQAYSKPVVYDSLYPMISRLLRHAQGQTLTEFWSPQATGEKILGGKSFISIASVWESTRSWDPHFL